MASNHEKVTFRKVAAISKVCERVHFLSISTMVTSGYYFLLTFLQKAVFSYRTRNSSLFSALGFPFQISWTGLI